MTTNRKREAKKSEAISLAAAVPRTRRGRPTTSVTFALDLAAALEMWEVEALSRREVGELLDGLIATHGPIDGELLTVALALADFGGTERQRDEQTSGARESRHVENRMVKAQCIAEFKNGWATGRWPSRNEAAKKLATTYSRSERTVRNWMRNI